MTRDLTTLAAEINRFHWAAEEAIGTALGYARQAGALLIEAKAQVQHGEWGPWLAEHFRGSDRTARLYMQIARRWTEIEAKSATVADLPLRDALGLLAEPKAPTRTQDVIFDEFRATVRAIFEPRMDIPTASPYDERWDTLRALVDEWFARPPGHIDFERVEVCTSVAARLIEAAIGCILNDVAEAPALQAYIRPAKMPRPEFLERFEPLILERAKGIPPRAVPSEADIRTWRAFEGLADMPAAEAAAVVAEIRAIYAEPADASLRRTVAQLAERYDVAAWEDLHDEYERPRRRGKVGAA